MIQKFIEYINTEKRYSGNTVKSYQKDLDDFKIFHLKTEGSEIISKSNSKAIRNYMMYLSEKKLSKRSINRKLSTLRSYYHFLIRVGDLTDSPMQSIESLKFNAKIQIPMSKDEMMDLQHLLEEETNTVQELIIEVLYQTGMRRAELCTLLFENVDFSSKELRVIGKGNKTRIIPVSKELCAKLSSYTNTRKPIESAKHLFFVTEKGKKITEKFVYLTVSSYLSLVTSKEKKSPHILRHSFATHLLDNGAEISKVQKLLGHASLASTQVYTHANIEQLKKVYNNAHPRAKKYEDEAE